MDALLSVLTADAPTQPALTGRPATAPGLPKRFDDELLAVSPLDPLQQANLVPAVPVGPAGAVVELAPLPAAGTAPQGGGALGVQAVAAWSGASAAAGLQVLGAASPQLAPVQGEAGQGMPAAAELPFVLPDQAMAALPAASGLGAPASGPRPSALVMPAPMTQPHPPQGAPAEQPLPASPGDEAPAPSPAASPQSAPAAPAEPEALSPPEGADEAARPRGEPAAAKGRAADAAVGTRQVVLGFQPASSVGAAEGAPADAETAPLAEAAAQAIPIRTSDPVPAGPREVAPGLARAVAQSRPGGAASESLAEEPASAARRSGDGPGLREAAATGVLRAQQAAWSESVAEAAEPVAAARGREEAGASRRAIDRDGSPSDAAGDVPQSYRPAHGARAANMEERVQPWVPRADGAAAAASAKELLEGSRVVARGTAGGSPAAVPGVEKAGGRRAVEDANGLGGAGLVAEPRPAAAPQGDARVVELTPGQAAERLPGLAIEHAELARRGAAQELRVRLRPPDLGEIHVSFRAQDGALKGTIAVEHRDVRDWVEARLPQWRQELSGAGLRVERLDVSLLAQNDGGSQPWANGSGGQGPQPQSAPAGPAVPQGVAAAVETPVLGVNAAPARGSIDYWA